MAKTKIGMFSLSRVTPVFADADDSTRSNGGDYPVG